MQDFWFYIKLGLNHVLDFSAYDHILFLCALAIPFTFKSWKKVVVLATIFTITHCISLALSAFEIVVMDVTWIEFMIPVTILFTALFNLMYLNSKKKHKSMLLHVLATAFFGLIHGFGFSNFFKMLVAEEEEKFGPLLGFAAGIEIAQVLIVLFVLVLAFLVQNLFRTKQKWFILVGSIIILLITIPLLISTFPL